MHMRKADRILDAFFDPNNRGVASFRECYVAITGDKSISGYLKGCDPVNLRESLDSQSFSAVLGNAINRRMVQEYNTPDRYDVWKKLATVVNVPDFRNQNLTRFGGYGDLPIVGERDPYPALTSPGDESASYGVTKRGGTEDITLEMIKNDDVRSIRAIPKKLAQAAKRTLSKFVLDFLRLNPVVYDGVALFHASHNNLGNTALSAVSMAAARASMQKQRELGSNDPLGLTPKYLLVAFDQEETAYNLFRRGTNLDKTFVQSLDVEVIPVWYWDDINDWCAVADPAMCPTVEVGFLDGEEEPELFLQDHPSVGSMFSNDKLTYKIRHIYSGAAVDYRGIYKAVVAG